MHAFCVRIVLTEAAEPERSSPSCSRTCYPRPVNRATGWIRNPVWDLSLLALPWVPLYFWFVFGLHLDAGGGEVAVFGRHFDALALAALVVLAITFVHRHYTFVLVYGDAPTFTENARSYVITPIVLFAILLAARSGADVTLVGGVSAWDVALAISGTWNVWHTVQQRYGIFRVYAGKAGGGLESRVQARRDQSLMWSLVIAIALAMLLFRRITFLGHDIARHTLLMAMPILDAPWFTPIAITLGVAVALVIAVWTWHEIRAPLTFAQRVPRLTFLGSTLLLFCVFLVHGPIVGYLCFGSAHALEYLAFVHHFGERKFAGRPDARSPAALLLRRPLVMAPVLAGSLVAAYALLQSVSGTDLYLAYYIGSSMLHFLYDGWIWKVRKPAVAAPLGARTA